MTSIIHDIKSIIDQAEKFKSAYFFAPPCNAAARRYYEDKNSRPEITWTENGHIYTAAFTISCSCKNVYAKGMYTRDGKQTTLTAIKNSYARLAKEAEQ